MTLRFRSRSAALVLGLALVAAACGGDGHGGAEPDSAASGVVEAQRQGDPAPSTSFEKFSGESATLASYSGKPLVLNFWASWCPSCVAEMSAAFRPAQIALGEEVAFLGMNIADERDRALDLVEETGAIFDLAEDVNGELYRELGGLGMPFTVFVSADGSILDVHNGPLTEGQLVDRISDVLLS
jgi:thiol-disulfide isomerase/thioredoxin